MSRKNFWAVRRNEYPFFIALSTWKPHKSKKGFWVLEKPTRSDVLLIFSENEFKGITEITLNPGDGPIPMKLVPIEK